MFRSKTNRESASTSSKDASKKSKKVSEKKNRSKLSVSIPLGENETQSCQNNNADDRSASIMPAAEGSTKKTEPLSTPKRENTFRDMETREPRTQTRLTLKYDDLLLSQTVDPQCEVSWECISPEMVQKIHRDIQRKPNLDISKILSLLKDFQEDDPPSNSSGMYISTKPSTRPHVSCSKTVPLKRKLTSRKDTTSSKMEDLIKKLEMQIKNEAEKKLADDSENHKRVMDSLETILPLQRTSSKIQGEICSNQNSTVKCLPDVSEPSSSDSKAIVSLDQIDQNFDSGMINNEETSWSDDDLFSDESFIAKVAQTSENKANAKIDKNKISPTGIVSDRLLANSDKKNSNNHYKNSLLGLEFTDATDKHTNIKSNGEFPKCKSANATDSDFTAKSGSSSTNDIDVDFSDSDTDELLSQLTEQEISCSVQLVVKKHSFSTKNVCTDNSVGLPDPVTATTVDCKTDKKLPVIEKPSIDSYLEFLDIPMTDSFRKPSPRKPFKTPNESSTKKKHYNFKTIKNNNKLTYNNNNISATCTVSSKQNNNVASLDISFDDPFSDKDDEMLRFAEALDTTEEKVEVQPKKHSANEILPKAKPVCTKEEIERKKREALIRRKKLCAITKSNMK